MLRTASMIVLYIAVFIFALGRGPTLGASSSRSKLPSCTAEDFGKDWQVFGNSLCHTNGSESPPPDLGKGRLLLYCMRFCPFSMRVRLMLNGKNISYDVINIDPYNQPSWYSAINLSRQVPSIQLHNGTRIHGSIAISEYIDGRFLGEKYKHGKLNTSLMDAVTQNIAKPTKRLLNLTLPVERDVVEKYWRGTLFLEQVLSERNTAYFSGATMGFEDLMIWPWIDRAPVMTHRPEINKFIEDFAGAHLLKLHEWTLRMRKNSLIQRTGYSDDLYWKYYKAHDCNVGLCDCQDGSGF